MRKILLTGFQPFLNESINPSEKLIEVLASDRVEILLLPVSFRQSYEILNAKLVSSNNFEKIILLGQAGGRSKISLERVALNWVETEHADEENYLPKKGVIDETKPAAYFNNWSLEKYAEKISNQGVPVEISLSAGSFVCNYLYYKIVAEYFHHQLIQDKFLFVHVPFLPEQVIYKPHVPSMEFSQMKMGMETLLDNLNLV